MTRERRKDRPVRLDRVLDGVLDDCGLSDRLGERRALAAWTSIVGDDIAAHSRALDLRDGVLVLQADHGAWIQELTLLSPVIRERFNERFGADTVTEIRWARPGTGRHRDDSQD